MTRNEWNTKEDKIRQKFLWDLGLKATHQKTQSEYQTDANKLKTEKLNKLSNRYYLPKRNEKISQGEIFFEGKLSNRYNKTATTEGTRKKPNQMLQNVTGKKRQGIVHKQRNIYGTKRNETEGEIKKSKLQIFLRTKLEPEPPMSTTRIIMSKK